MNVSRNIKENYVAARIMRQKELTEKNFSLKKYGNWEAAEEAARSWIASLRPTLPLPISSKGRLTRRNHSGHVGVYYARGLANRPNGRRYEYPRWVARWPGCPFRGGLSWSVRKYEADTFVLAVLSRRLETVDRAMILAELDAISGQKAHREILDRLKL